MLGLPFAPPYLGLSEFERRKVMTGINYASAACGILPLSGSKAKECLSMDKQIKYFNLTIAKDLPNVISNSEQLNLYLSKSIFLVSVGVNDYSLNYLINLNGLWTGYTPEAFGDFLLDEFVIRMQQLYDLGARTFVVNAAFPLGSTPFSVVNVTRSKEVNQQINYFTSRVPERLQELQSQLPKFSFTGVGKFQDF
ncbi:GDSL esterase/lipase family [Quillaja saponaria]|uniref:GDSL esterase/lipase family n=1 Tax=Quillaja saponaria TaxID=32244 RepID=A0AAD7PFR7_QUISA|nr:GDSL esterase/lipase family [Quillaja saponaria]